MSNLSFDSRPFLKLGARLTQFAIVREVLLCCGVAKVKNLMPRRTKGEMPCDGIYPELSEQAPENAFRQNYRSNDYLMLISSGEEAE